MLVLKLRPAHLKQFEDLESNTGTISTGGGKKKLLSRRSAWNKQDDWAMQKDNDGRISTKTPVKKSSEQSRKRAKLESRLMVRPFTRAGSTSDDSTLGKTSLSSLPPSSSPEIPLAHQMSSTKQSAKRTERPPASATNGTITSLALEEAAKVEHNRLRRENGHLQFENDHLREENEQFQAANTRLNDQVASLSAEATALKIADLTKDYQTLRDRMTEVELQNRELTNKNKTLEAQIEVMTTDEDCVTQLAAENAQLTERVSTVLKEKGDVARENEGLKQQVNRLETEIKEEIKAFEEYKSRVRALGNEFRNPRS